jgi:hypothetical protein
MKSAQTLTTIFVVLLLASVTQAQTRKIAHRSHSGVPATFAFFMEDDHLGGPPITFPYPDLDLENYDVKPWIDSLKRKYEPAAAAEGGSTTPTTTPKDSISPPQKQRPRAPKGKYPAAGYTPPNETGTPPTSLSSAAPSLHSSTATRNSLGLLMALLLFPVAPAVFLLSAVWSSQRKVA